MQRLQGTLFWTIIASETTHLFCCVLPTVISVLSLLGGAGLLAVLPPGLLAFHEMIHKHEVPLILFSAAMLLIGWGLYLLSARLDCHSTGCAHGPCGPKKKNASLALKIASMLFVGNVVIYVTFHMN